MNGVSELNKRKVRLFVEAVWNQGRLELIEELIADDYVGRVACVESGVFGPQGVRRLVAGRRRAHPDLHVKIEDEIAEEDRVVTRWHATTKAAAARDGSARTGRTPCYAGISIIRLLAGKQVDSHTEYTSLTHDEAGLDELAEVNAPFRSSLGST
ncbi:MAG: ester cyclase [Thermoleophilaceae bacterium]